MQHQGSRYQAGGLQLQGAQVANAPAQSQCTRLAGLLCSAPPTPSTHPTPSTLRTGKCLGCTQRSHTAAKGGVPLSTSRSITATWIRCSLPLPTLCSCCSSAASTWWWGWGVGMGMMGRSLGQAQGNLHLGPAALSYPSEMVGWLVGG